MDTLWAPVYDERWGATIDPTHRSFVERVLQRCPHSRCRVRRTARGRSRGSFPFSQGRPTTGRPWRAVSGWGHHYYPATEQVRAWIDLAGFRVVDDGIGDDYHHFLCD